jgi:hypothetical protein
MRIYRALFGLLVLHFAFQTIFAQKLIPHKISLKNGRTFNLNLPADYEIIPAAEGLKRVRFSLVRRTEEFS